jgi:ribosomal protein S18 acetylase RimI-like enzyme
LIGSRLDLEQTAREDAPDFIAATAMPGIATRRATLDDLDAIAPLFDAYRGFYGQPGDLDRARDWLRERMQRDESVVLVAQRDDAVVGFAQLYPMFSSVHTTRTWILNDLYVDAAARRGGAARALLDAAAAYARDGGAGAIALETTRDNTPARALYRAAGWREDETQWYSLPLRD